MTGMSIERQQALSQNRAAYRLGDRAAVQVKVSITTASTRRILTVSVKRIAKIPGIYRLTAELPDPEFIPMRKTAYHSFWASRASGLIYAAFCK